MLPCAIKIHCCNPCKNVIWVKLWYYCFWNCSVAECACCKKPYALFMIWLVECMAEKFISIDWHFGTQQRKILHGFWNMQKWMMVSKFSGKFSSLRQWKVLLWNWRPVLVGMTVCSQSLPVGELFASNLPVRVSPRHNFTTKCYKEDVIAIFGSEQTKVCILIMFGSFHIVLAWEIEKGSWFPLLFHSWIMIKKYLEELGFLFFSGWTRLKGGLSGKVPTFENAQWSTPKSPDSGLVRIWKKGKRAPHLQLKTLVRATRGTNK